MKKIKSIITVSLFAVILFSVSAMCYFGEDQEYTQSERRALLQLPEVSKESVLNGEFMSEFEKYSADQFPFREKLRSLKALFNIKLLKKLENNGLFVADGHISKLDEKENNYMMNYAAELFQKIIDTNMTDKNAKIYFSIVPDKNYYLAEKNGYPSLDYDGFIERMREKTEFMSYIDITQKLSLDDYYKTDSHWKQENIKDVANHLAQSMGADVNAEYKVNVLDNPFYGVYAGQSALACLPDTIKYLTNDTIDNCTVTYYGTGKPEKGDMYDMEKAFDKDPYEMFLSGVAPLIVIENPDAKTDKELVLLRDSFGSSLAPLMAQGYKKVTVVDVRYIQSSFIGNFVEFDNCDVLFLYSTALLNNSLSMK